MFLQVVGLYRLCGSAAVKKELREAFERDSHAVELCENMYPDVNVITGNVKVLHYFLAKCLFCTLSSHRRSDGGDAQTALWDARPKHSTFQESNKPCVLQNIGTYVVKIWRRCTSPYTFLFQILCLEFRNIVQIPEIPLWECNELRRGVMRLWQMKVR